MNKQQAKRVAKLQLILDAFDRIDKEPYTKQTKQTAMYEYVKGFCAGECNAVGEAKYKLDPALWVLLLRGGDLKKELRDLIVEIQSIKNYGKAKTSNQG